MNTPDTVVALGLLGAAAPFALLALFGISSLLDCRLSERATMIACHATNLVGLMSSAFVLAYMLIAGDREVPLELGDWVAVSGYHFMIKLVYDRLSVPFVLLTFVLCGTVGAFSGRYLHRESGFNRFFVLFAMFLAGMVLAALAGTIEALFAGWELVGLSSALLVAFFQDRPAPARNGLRVWVVYRMSDAALLLAAIFLHHLAGSGDFNRILGAGPWPDRKALIAPTHAFAVGFLLLIAAAAKSALIPFSSWLPRAMEGPTSSSAVFYGALSVHLGAYLLLRAGPLLSASPALSAIVVGLGLLTAVYAYLAGSVQADIKTVLAYASLAQVGLIVAEAGLGWHYLALVHLLGHACLRTMQFLRAPTLLHDYHTLRNAFGDHLPQGGPSQLLPGSVRAWVYRFALERGYLDALLDTFVVRPFVGTFHWFDRLERRWTDWIAGTASREFDAIDSAAGQIEDLS